MNQFSLHAGIDYAELREHEVRKVRKVMIDGNLTANTETSEGGVSARVFNKGYWGFASIPAMDQASRDKVARKAVDNASAMCRFGEKPELELAGNAYQGEQSTDHSPAMSQQESIELMEAVDAHCKDRYPNLKSTSVILHEESHRKSYGITNDGSGLNTINRAACYILMTAEDKHGQPVQIMEPLSTKGNLADLNLTMNMLEPVLDELHGHLQAKCNPVPVKGGDHTIVLSPALAGMLAHEAMGHPCEADIVLGGAITGNLVNQQIASELITMVDFAHSYNGQELMIPVYADDEGTEAIDAVLIENGVLKDFMSSRETAAKLGIQATGNARAYTFSDEPLVRMRNTAILPGKSKLADMISDVEHGYYLMKTGNGEADSTTEFMFGITLAYEIRNGKLGRAITDTTVSGRAINMLRTVDAVSDDMHWECSGYCGKKQPMVVSMGGPAIRAMAHLGGE
jgi:TldD protein